MDKQVQITFRNMRASASLEDHVRARVAWLERFHPDLVSCHVLLEVPHRHHAHGQHVHVRIEMSLPGENAVVNHEPTLHGHARDVQDKAHHKDTDIDAAHKLAPVAIRDAFEAARRRLDDAARRR
jgi:ribosome-associated translation inhibitor RaiA